MFTAEAVGGFLGSLRTTKVAARLGQDSAMCASVVVSGELWLLALPFFHADWRYAVACVLQGLGWTAFMTFRISSVALRQRLTPAPLLGSTRGTDGAADGGAGEQLVVVPLLLVARGRREV
ncbi:hypothetical protein ACWFR1_37825 [Streptomyces sp. NPDC055103]